MAEPRADVRPRDPTDAPSFAMARWIFEAEEILRCVYEMDEQHAEGTLKDVHRRIAKLMGWRR